MKRAIALSILLAVAACLSEPSPTGSSDPSGMPTATGPLAASLVVSDPGPGPAALLAGPANSPGETVVYVSLPPATLPARATVRITNRRTFKTVIPVVTERGFDPSPIAAAAGDTIDVAVTEPSGTTSNTQVVVVRSRPPRVVRTSPPKGQTDVPLNSIIVIVVSEPIDPATVNGNGVRLRRGAEVVAGSLVLDPGGTIIRFVPESSLQPGTRYEIDVTDGLADLTEVPLEAAVTVEFTTTPALVEVSTGGYLTFPSPYGDRVPNLACFLTAAGAAWCAGQGDFGENGSGLGRFVDAAAPVVGSHTFASLTAGYEHVCAVTNAGQAFCWGNDNIGTSNDVLQGGRLGTGTGLGDCKPDGPKEYPRMSCSLAPVAVAGGIEWAQISAGSYHTCGISTDGAAYCWGVNRVGQLGTGTTVGVSVPVPVAGGIHWSQISAGAAHTCGLDVQGTAFCWGENNNGRLGDGTTTGRLIPVRVAGGHAFIQISAGSEHSCGLLATGATYCWGPAWSLGNGSSVATLEPALVALPAGVALTSIDAGWSATCGVDVRGAGYCWGGFYESWHQEDYTLSAALPVTVPGNLAFRSISSGQNLSCGVTTGMKVYCWGQADSIVGVPFRLAGQP